MKALFFILALTGILHADDVLTVTASTQDLTSVCAVYKAATGRTLLCAHDIQKNAVSVGPFSASKQEAETIIREALALQGFQIRKMTETVDMLATAQAAAGAAAATPPKIEPMVETVTVRPVSRTFTLRHASADDLKQQLALVFGATVTAASFGSGGLFVRCPADDVEAVEAFVRGADIVAPLIRVRAIIGQVTLGGQYETGIDFLRALDDFSAGNSGQQTIIPTRADAASLVVYGQLGAFSRYLKLAEEDKDFRAESRPSLFVRSGSSADISSGQRVPYPQTTLTQATGTVSTSATVAYQEVLLRLKIEAVAHGERVRLKITQTNDTISGTATIGANQVPTVSSQALTTEVDCVSGQTVALGGIVTHAVQRKARGVSGLRRIPLVGRLFDVAAKSSTDEELIILLEATVEK